MSTHEARLGLDTTHPDVDSGWPYAQTPEAIFTLALRDYNPGYLNPNDWARASAQTFGRSETLLRKIAYEIWKDWISRVPGDERLLLPAQKPEKKIYPMPVENGKPRETPHRFIARSFLNRGKIAHIASVLEQFAPEYHELAVRLVHGGWRNYTAFFFRDKFYDIMRDDMAAGTRVSPTFRGKKYSFSISPIYLLKGTAMVAHEAALAAYHAVRSRLHQYQDQDAPHKLQDKQKPDAIIYLCHDSRVDGQTSMDVPGIGRVLIDRTVGGNIEDANDPMSLSDDAMKAFTHAMHIGAKEIILTTHGRCGCVKNGICQHGKPAIPTMSIDGQVMHQLSRVIKYAVDALDKKGPFGEPTMQDYALSLFDMNEAEQKYVNGEAKELAVETLTGLHRIELVRHFVAKYTTSNYNAMLMPMLERNNIGMAMFYLGELRDAKLLKEAAYTRIRSEILQGEKAVIGFEDVTPDVKVRLAHKEIRTLDTHLWNDDAARFVRMTRNHTLNLELAATRHESHNGEPSQPPKGRFGKLSSLMMNL